VASLEAVAQIRVVLAATGDASSERWSSDGACVPVGLGVGERGAGAHAEQLGDRPAARARFDPHRGRRLRRAGVGQQALLPNVLDVNVRAPGVGTRDGDARITDVVVQANVVTFIAVDDGEFVCDPNSDSAPPASRPWSANFAAEVGTKRQAPATLRTDWYRRSRYVVRPRVVGLGFGPGLAENDTVRRVTWKRFGGHKAVGFGIFKVMHFFCPSRDRCARENGERVRVELTRPSYCSPDNVVPAGDPVSNFVFYGKIAAITPRRVGVLKPGTEFESYKPDCRHRRPVRLR
jgi:hypothetical protein